MRHKRLALAAALVGVAVTAGGCGHPPVPRSERAITQTSQQQPTATVTPSVGTVVTHVPARHLSVGVVVLHSYGHGVTEPVDQGWNRVADEYGFVGIYPSRGPDWNAGLCCGGAAKQDRDDVRWLTDQINQVKKRLRLTNIFLAGNSNGGMMVERLVTESPALTNRFVTWAAAPEMPKKALWHGDGFLYYGTADTTVPPNGGIVTIGGRPTVVKPGSRLVRCLPNARLVSIPVPGAGHSPPANWPELAWAALSHATAFLGGGSCPD